MTAVSPEQRIRLLWRENLRIWIVLVLLFALSLGLAYVPMRGLNVAFNLLLAFVMAAVGVIYFMGLRRDSGLIRLVAVAGIFWLIIMFVLTFADYATRFNR